MLRGLGAGMTRRRWLVTGGLVAVILVLEAVNVVRLNSQYAVFGELVDLGVYRMGGQGILNASPLYDLHYRIIGLPFTYTPFAAIVFVPFARLTHAASTVVWTALSLTALYRSCYLLARELDRPALQHREDGGRAWPSWSRLELTLGLYAFALATEPVWSTLEFGQINLIIMWLVLEDLLGRASRRWNGVLVGVATGLKLIPGLFIVFLLLTRRLRAATIAAGVFAITVLAGFAVQPGQTWQYWTRIAYDSSRVGRVGYVGNQSLNGVLTRTFPPDGSRALWFVLAVVVVVVSLRAATRLWNAELRVPAIAAVATAALLASPISWNHHWVWFVVIVAALVEPALGRPALRWTLIVATTLVSVSHVYWLAPKSENRDDTYTLAQFVAANVYAEIAAVLVVFFACSAAAISRRCTPARSEPASPRAHRAAA